MLIRLSRRKFISLITGISLLSYFEKIMAKEILELSDSEWQARLSDEEYYILRKEGTERPGTSVLNDEKRKGIYHCVGCEQALFTSAMKFDSGTGWPSFFDYLPNALEFKTDFKLVIPRKEYHCSRCGGHHGHVFKDGPEPTGLRYCNNGLVLNFIPD
ncbi:peptide-methionine (R)-S-oxide reductase MsrB [Alphaproteobacteria bacterium]|nr:peptide-methionine (R)-S-oxide reductase MsrB [Alphaproteobacteria bacterium]